MREFARRHFKALRRVFLVAILAFLVARGVQLSLPHDGPGEFGTPMIVSAFPLGWGLASLADSLLWKLPLAWNLMFMDVLLAVGFAANVVSIAAVSLHFVGTGRLRIPAVLSGNHDGNR